MPVIAPIQRANRGSHFRALGLRGMAELIDPFIGVDHAWMSAPTFPAHPHAGFSAVSYIFADSETGMDNRDSIGTHNLIRPGGLHWTTAGRGVVHEEVPAEPGKTVHSLQIFVSLARDRQDIAPFALSLEPEEVPVVRAPGAEVRVPLGHFGEFRSPMYPPTDVTLLDIRLEDGAELSVPIAAGESAFIMPIFGPVEVQSRRFDGHDLRLPVFAAQTAPHAITLRAPQGVAKAILFSGQPLRRRPHQSQGEAS